LWPLPLPGGQGLEQRSRGPFGPASRVQRSYERSELEKAGRVLVRDEAASPGRRLL
jgi:hypothetical protein